jgi:hypothetical protein
MGLSLFRVPGRYPASAGDAFLGLTGLFVAASHGNMCMT